MINNEDIYKKTYCCMNSCSEECISNSISNIEFIETKKIVEYENYRKNCRIYTIPFITECLVKNLKTNIPFHNIDYISIQFGKYYLYYTSSNYLEKIDSKYFNVLKYIYDIEEEYTFDFKSILPELNDIVNKYIGTEYKIIPSYNTSKIGIPLCNNEKLNIFVYFKEDLLIDGNIIIDYYRILEPNNTYDLLYYEIQESYGYYERYYFNYPTFYIFSNNLTNTIELKLETHNKFKTTIKVIRDKIIDDIGIYKISNSLKDIKNTINFTLVDKIESDTKILGCLSSNIVRYQPDVGCCILYKT